MHTTRIKTLLLSATALVAAAAAAAPAPAAMRSERISANLCLTTGGGRMVPIPGFPGERIDRRLLTDIALLQRRYKIYVTDGYSTDPVHSANGEHPMGLAADIVPNEAAGGSWRQISALAKFAEPVQNDPMAPFRWVGYDGDSGHGRGHHLHLSWNHSETAPGQRARSVYTLRCPGAPVGGNTGTPPPPSDGTGTKAGSGGGGRDEPDGPAGGVSPGRGTGNGGYGVGRVAERHGFGGRPVIETGGVGR